MIQTDSESYSAVLQLSFFYYFSKLVMWPPSWQPIHCMDPDRYNHPYLVFLHLLVKLSDIFFLGYMHRTLTWTLKAVPHYTLIICTIPMFFWFFWYCFIGNIQISFFGHLPWTLKTPPNNTDHLSYQEMQMFPYLEMHTGPWTPQCHHQQSPIFFC